MSFLVMVASFDWLQCHSMYVMLCWCGDCNVDHAGMVYQWTDSWSFHACLSMPMSPAYVLVITSHLLIFIPVNGSWFHFLIVLLHVADCFCLYMLQWDCVLMLPWNL